MAPSIDTGRERLYGALGTGAVLTGALAYVGFGDPHSPAFLFPTCPFYALTDLYCPGCGGLRMTHDLLHGDIAAAAFDNVFLLVGLPLLVAWCLVRWRQGKALLNAPAIVVVITAVLVWSVTRNLPGFPLVPTVLDG